MPFTDAVPQMFQSISDEFGESVVYRHSGVDTTIRAVPTEGNAPEAASLGRWAHLMILGSSLASDPVPGDTVTLRGQTYRVSQADASQFGVWVLKLQKQ